jgi:hypothetical protein
MNLISKLLPEPNVLLDLDVASKKRVFEQAGLLFENNNQIARSQVFDSLFARACRSSPSSRRCSATSSCARSCSRRPTLPTSIG